MVTSIAIVCDLPLLVTVPAPLHLPDRLVVGETVRIFGQREERLCDGFCHFVNAYMALGALNFA